jgi:hypothetical protein
LLIFPVQGFVMTLILDLLLLSLLIVLPLLVGGGIRLPVISADGSIVALAHPEA